MRGEEGEGEGVDRSLDPGIGGLLGNDAFSVVWPRRRQSSLLRTKNFRGMGRLPASWILGWLLSTGASRDVACWISPQAPSLLPEAVSPHFLCTRSRSQTSFCAVTHGLLSSPDSSCY